MNNRKIKEKTYKR